MRSWLAALTIAVGYITLGTATAHADVPRSSGGNGVVVGSANAPVQLEIFIEPQCPHVAELEAADGDAIARDIADGRLAVTYRPLTFLGDRKHNDVSARISNALFLAADPSTPSAAYQAFVQDLYRNQTGPDNAAIASMARESGIPGAVADRIAAGDYAVDTAAMNDANRARLKEENPENPGTPTVYDLNTKTVVDTQDSDWLAKL
ncbi:protein disulfide-isomerase [Mycobacterium sp. MFM001]|uniref:DsbA family protein n=1 Tax=Mycobacterium sp. MFM001 TaxID=2049453 RepID=UPI000DA54A0D|nr:thioredoxin domain-containing protein [Mycobacterium sp. MFM001]GBE65199.1 protein disulfide-isomerase [Mycobacterium sp. MFM001]